MSRNITFCDFPNVVPTDLLINYCLDQCDYMIDKCYCDCIENDIPGTNDSQYSNFDMNNILMFVTFILFIMCIIVCGCCKITNLKLQKMAQYNRTRISAENEILQDPPTYLNGLPQYSEIYIPNDTPNVMSNDIHIIPPPYKTNPSTYIPLD